MLQVAASTRLWMFVVGSIALATLASPGRADETIDFTRQIRPLLSSRCFNCHGPDEGTRESGLRLDTTDGALAEADSGVPAIVPGNIDESELIARIRSDEPGYRMPPEDIGAPLSAEEVALVEKWVAQGAAYESHWAFTPPQRSLVPLDAPSAWTTDAIDAFVLARLKSLQLTPNPPADRATLARRLSLDLIGVPPEPDRVRRLLADPRPDALERYVDELLASPAYGERWAAVWLDLARYADSQGYAQDSPRTIWRYRDWVIDAFNENMPFDQFTIEQIAGDMLDDPSRSQLIATAFHRNTMTNSEGGTDDEEFRVAAVVDRVNTTMQVWMGMTMGCAQCHSHKYDPISQEEYFQFYAILNQTEDRDHPEELPVLSSYSEERRRQRESLEQQIDELQQVIDDLGTTEPQLPDLKADAPLPTRYVRVVLLADQTFLSLAEVQAFVGETNVATSGSATQSSTAFDGPPQLAIDGNTDGHYTEAKSTTHSDRENQPWWELDLREERHLNRLVIWNRDDTGEIGDRLKPFRVVLMDAQRQPLWVGRFDEAPRPSLTIELPHRWGEHSQDSLARLTDYLKLPEASTTGEGQKLAGLKKQLADLGPDITTPIMRELKDASLRKTYIHVRGNFRNPGTEVAAGLPAAFQPLAAGDQPDRLGLAHWLVAEDNPLTARVIVNRFWERLFGIGLVETSEDFGTQGALPSHPELLDRLALEFIDRGWDVKWLLREIVLSQTYQQSSQVSAEKLANDPYNQWLARGPRFRLPAETIRDQALAAAGLLSHKMFGPSVQPPRPNLGLRAAFGGSTDWQPSPGEDRYRRGLYTSWRRTSPYPSMTTFDATSREVCTIRRIRTNTPLQALVTLNDPVFVEAAQSLARRVLQEQPDQVDAALTHLFWLVLSREPTEDELTVLSSTLEQAKAQFENDPDAARKLATEPLGPLPDGSDSAEYAAWTLLANVVLNLDEVLARP